MSTKTELVNFHDYRQKNHPENLDREVYIGRPSKWGNPFIIGQHGDREEVVAKYETWIRQQPELLAALPELEGKVLICYCKPKPCHGDVLLQLLQEKDAE